MERKEGGISLTVVASKLSPAAAVTVSFPTPDFNWFVLQKLLSERPCGCATLASGSEYTALVYAMYDDIRDRLLGTPDAQLKSKVSSITCGFHNGEFIISYVCQSSITAIRKSLGILVSRLAPHKQYPRYQKYIKLLGGKPNRDEFMNCAKRIASKRNVSAVVVAKIKTDKEKEDAIVKVVANKLADVSGIDSGVKPASESLPRTSTEFPEIKSPGYERFFVLDYLDSINVSALGTGNTIIVFNKKWSGVKKDAIDRYVSTRFGKLGEKLLHVVLYSACSRGLLRTHALREIARSKLNPNGIANIIKSALT